MSHSNQVNWQPISGMPLIASMIDGALNDTRGHLATLIKARAQPHVLDDATLDRSERVHNEQLEYVDIYAQQIARWRTEKPTPDPTRELDRLDEQNRQLRAVTAGVLALARELRSGTINRVMEMSDLELGVQALLSNRPDSRR